MSKFKQLIMEVKSAFDKKVEFFIMHGIDPRVNDSSIRLDYPEANSLCILRDPVKTSPFFRNGGNVSPKDSVEVQLFKEERTPTQSDITGNWEIDKRNPTMGNTYSKDYGTRFEMTVDEYMEKIYNHPNNFEIKISTGLKDLDTEEERKEFLAQYQQKRDIEDTEAEADYQNWKELNKDVFDLGTGRSEKEIDRLLRALYKDNKEGIEIEDILPKYIWAFENGTNLKFIDDKIKHVKDKENRAKLKSQLEKLKIQLFKQQYETITHADENSEKKNFKDFVLDNQKTLIDWWRSIPNNMKESMLTEFTRNNPFAPKPTPIKDIKQVEKALNSIFGNDSDRFLTNPIINIPAYHKEKFKSYEKDPTAQPLQKLIVVGFPDESKLDDENGIVRVKDVNGGWKGAPSFDMNIGELREIINRPENQGTELDTREYRLTPGNEFTTLNPGKGGKWVDLPDEVIIKMLDTISKEDAVNSYLALPLVKYFKREKESGKPNPQVLKALQRYNQSGFHSSKEITDEIDLNNEIKRGATITRRMTKDGIKYQGLIPDDGHIAVQPGWVHSRFKKYV